MQMQAGDAIAEVLRIAGPAAAELCRDAEAGRIAWQDLLRWVRDNDRKRRQQPGRCRRCGELIRCRILVTMCLSCVRKEG